MKHFNYVSILCMTFLFALSGCENADYEVQDNNIYISDANGTAKSITVTMDDGADIAISIRLAKKMPEDVEVALTFDDAVLQKFNEENGTEYEILAADKLPKNVTVTIPAGEINAIYQLHIDDFETNGITYAVPLVLGEVVKGNVPKSMGMNHFIYVLAKPLKVSVPVMRPYSDELGQTNPETDWGEAVETYTLEAWVRMSNFNRNNQAIFNLRANNELYVRFGDANSPYNYLQVKAHGDGGTETGRDWTPQTWYHVAIVYDGNELIIYRNGIRVAGKQVPAPKGGMIINGLQIVSSSAQYFPAECGMSQVHLWNYARSVAEIQNNMYYEVNPKNPNLIAAWPMDEGQGNVFRDITGKGRDIIADEGLIRRWEPDVRFDGK